MCNVLLRLMCVTTWSPVGGAVLLRTQNLAGEMGCWEMGLKGPSPALVLDSVLMVTISFSELHPASHHSGSQPQSPSPIP